MCLSFHMLDMCQNHLLYLFLRQNIIFHRGRYGVHHVKDGQLTILLDVDKQLILSMLHVFSHKETTVFMVANMYHSVLGPLTRFQSDGHIQHIFVLLFQVLLVFC